MNNRRLIKVGLRKKELFNTRTEFSLEETDKVFLGGVLINIEIPKNPKEGLSKRTSLCTNCGMLFFFSEEIAHITTQETRLPLDIVFLRENKIVHLATSKPYGKDYFYDADSVVELNAGFCRDNNINVGDYLQIDRERNSQEIKEDYDSVGVGPSSRGYFMSTFKAGGTVKKNIGGRLLKKGISNISNMFDRIPIEDVVKKTAAELTEEEKKVAQLLQLKKDRNILKKEMWKENRPQINQVLKDFKARIKTPEGLRRAEALGLSTEDLSHLDKLKLKSKPEIEDHYNPYNHVVQSNYMADPIMSKPIIRHEIEHATQLQTDRRGITFNSIDQDLRTLKLKPGKFDDDFPINRKPNEVTELGDSMEEILEKSKLLTNPKVTRGDTPIYNIALRDKDTAKEYFIQGSGGKEKAPMLAEVQQWALDNKLIKEAYEEVSPQKMKSMYTKYLESPEEEQFLRIFNIAEPTDSNFKLLADNFNKLLTVGAATGVGLVAASQYKKGGTVKNRIKKSPTKKISLNIQEEGTYLLDDKGNVQMSMQGNERIFSRPHTRQILSLVKKIEEEKDSNKVESLLVKLGELTANIILTHDTQEEEYTDD